MLENLVKHVGAEDEETLSISFTVKIKPFGADCNKVNVAMSFIKERVKASTGAVTVDETQPPQTNKRDNTLFLDGLLRKFRDAEKSTQHINKAAWAEAVDRFDKMIEKEE